MSETTTPARLNSNGVSATQTTKPVATVSLSQKVNVGNYGSADCFLSLSNITADTTPEQMDEMLDQAKLAWSKIAERIREKVGEIKAELGI